MKRKNLSPKDLAIEHMAIVQFTLNKLSPLEGARLPLQVIFEEYQRWRGFNKLSRTLLNIDGFGRLFPKCYERRAAFWQPAGGSLQCVFGVALKC